MEQEAWYAIFRFDEEIKALQAEAIIEVLTLSPGEKQSRLGSYGLTSPCRALSNAVLKGMYAPLESWATGCGLVIKDLEKPLLRPEAFRLQQGCALWPTQDHTALLMPLSNGKARVDLLPRGSNSVIPMDWDPGMVIHLNEMGLRLRGSGSVRFIYILFRTAPSPEYRVW
ncbi:hypothetical protein FZEAL_399 [Fusarium zealandicum]|uniref:Uncharacterized protein n=1 Tax=Fusarium zealandicum TaxID=1053134 RepID=A0A8H4UVJ2_9HYPO|nr:hypothetical protein FZEAL_399 [Fusarium zealandicum]